MMKKGMSVVLILALVATLATAMAGCGKENNKTGKKEKESTEPSPYAEMLQEMRDELTAEDDYSHIELTTDEHYEEEYDALTLPAAVPTTTQPETTTKKATADNTTTTIAVKRETTTQFMFTMASTTGATKRSEANKPKDEAQQNAAAGTTAKSTTKSTTGSAAAGSPNVGDGAQVGSPNIGEGYSDTTSMTNNVVQQENINVNNNTVQTRPQVTYLDKYVVDVLKGNSYTAVTEMRADGMVVPITYYTSGGKTSVSMRLSDLLAKEMDLPGFVGKMSEIRMVDDGKDFVLCIPGGYVKMEGEEMDEFRELFQESQKNQDIASALQIDRLQYCDRESKNGYIIEKYYLEEDNAYYYFYFDSQGLTQWDVYSGETGERLESMVIRLKAGVTNKNAFTYSGKKYTMEEIEKLFGVTA